MTGVKNDTIQALSDPRWRFADDEWIDYEGIDSHFDDAHLKYEVGVQRVDSDESLTLYVYISASRGAHYTVRDGEMYHISNAEAVKAEIAYKLGLVSVEPVFVQPTTYDAGVYVYLLTNLTNCVTICFGRDRYSSREGYIVVAHASARRSPTYLIYNASNHYDVYNTNVCLRSQISIDSVVEFIRKDITDHAS